MYSSNVAPGQAEARNSKWFDKLTTLSEVEGQILNSNFLNYVLGFGYSIFGFVSHLDIRYSNFSNYILRNDAIDYL